MEEKEGQVLICIKDEGIGIPNDKIEDLFKLDCNFNRPGTQNEKSTGMGLLLVKEYANIIGAELNVESEVNKGTTFLFGDKEIGNYVCLNSLNLFAR